ncbi:MAG: hypothetical protein A2Y14_01130 [Verrucomicrobia bacterium GWF2_51_19]|nr:MAG: hypothetical protein A2Y14_01130 [Verrucomicrobia bacterium GWF2_51_19]HCJ12533.1 DegT/DnrJ/EryC1/StrS family aminotransferase [Opitutae bacterium]
MKVGLLSLDNEQALLGDAYREAFNRVLTSGRFILGEEVERFERACEAYLGVKHAIGVSSGTDAILIALMAMDIGPGDEVLCPAFTFFATAGCIVRLGATPVWVDADSDTYNLSLTDAAKKVTPRTRAILPVPLFGQAYDVDALMAFANEHKIAVVEDFAQSWGTRFKGRCVGTFGTIGATSFFPTKNLGGFGDSGLVVTNDDRLGQKLLSLRTHGSLKRYYHDYVGGNFRIDALQAALLACKLPHVDNWIRQRRAHAAFYTKNLTGLAWLRLPRETPETFHTWNQFTVRVLDGHRDALKAFLAEREIQAEVYYPLSLDQQVCFQANTHGAETISVAHTLNREVLSLPIHPELTEDQMAFVMDSIRAFKH